MDAPWPYLIVVLIAALAGGVIATVVQVRAGLAKNDLERRE